MTKDDPNRLPSPLPIHFFTIVLNGEPFIRHHIGVFKQLPFRWHWHIIEGVAALTHDTGWSRGNGGAIGPELHEDGLSNDGTTTYLNEIRDEFPNQITIHRKADGAFWDGKVEMVNAPLADISEDCLLWQVDSDELWTVEQVCAAEEMFAQFPEKSAAYCYCHYFVSENLITTTRDTYGNHTSYEWLRIWRSRPGVRWFSHEPPRLCQRNSTNEWVDVASINPFTHRETEARGLVFQHYAYVTEKQLRFKETYYGYRGAFQQWTKLQECSRLPFLLREFFHWVKDAAAVDTARSQNVAPLGQCNVLGQWRFCPFELRPGEPKVILFIRPDSIGDTVLAASMLSHLRAKHPHALLVVVCQEQTVEIYEACPLVDRIIVINRQRAIKDAAYRNRVANRIQDLRADLCLNSVYSREPLTDFLALCSQAPMVVAHEGNTELMDAETRTRHNRLYSRLIPNATNSNFELDRHRDFLKGVGIDGADLRPNIWLKTEDEEFAEDLFLMHNLESNRTVALFAGAQSDCRIFMKYGESLAELCLGNGLAVVALGSQTDYAINQRNLEPLSVRSINLSGTLTLRQTAAVLERCRIAVGAETGLAHIACAVGTPNVVLLGGGHFGRFLPYSPLTSAVCLPLECYGCNWQCRFQRAHCVKDVAPKVFAEAIRRTMARGSEKPRVFVQGNSLWTTGPGFPNWRSFDRWLDSRLVEVIRIG